MVSNLVTGKAAEMGPWMNPPWAGITDLAFQDRFTPSEPSLPFAPQNCDFTDAPKLCTPGNQASVTQHTLCVWIPGKLNQTDFLFSVPGLHSSGNGHGLCVWDSGLVETSPGPSSY